MSSKRAASTNRLRAEIRERSRASQGVWRIFHRQDVWRRTLVAVGLVFSTVATAAQLSGTPVAGYKHEPKITSSTMPAAPSEIGFDQSINQQIPLDTSFTDEYGRSVEIGDYFGTRPVVTGRYSIVIMRVIRFGAAATVVGLGSFIMIMLRNERRRYGRGAHPQKPVSSPPSMRRRFELVGRQSRD
jgi:hypothetical protein